MTVYKLSMNASIDMNMYTKASLVSAIVDVSKLKLNS